MLREIDIDSIKERLRTSSEAVYLYYVAHESEGRMNSLTEFERGKSYSHFKVIRIRVTDVENAYKEYMRYLKNSDSYSDEHEFHYHDKNNPNTYYDYVYKSKNSSYISPKDRYPSLIYGYTALLREGETTLSTTVVPSPVDLIYTSWLSYNGTTDKASLDRKIKTDFDAPDLELDWKYMRATPRGENDPYFTSDGCRFDYITSDWYILKIADFPFAERPLIKAGAPCSFFMTPKEAFDRANQLNA